MPQGDAGPKGQVVDPFPRDALRSGAGGEEDQAKGSVGQIWEQLFWQLAERVCQVSEWKDYERTDRWDLAKTQEWIELVRSEVGSDEADGSDASELLDKEMDHA